MSEPTHRTVDTNGIRMHIAEQGAGPAVLLCHGFPELWYSWRHQLAALAAAGFHVVAPDMRGYGQTDAPPEIDRYTLLHHVGDMLGLLDALGIERAVIAGHDWGGPVAWLAAQLRPDRFRGVIALSSPFGPRGQRRPTEIMPQGADSLFYQLYFQTPGVAEAEFEHDVRSTIRAMLYAISGNAPDLVGSVVDRNAPGMVSREGGLLTKLPNPEVLPPWLSEADVDFYVSEFARTGFRGGLNWYRNIDCNWELLAPFVGTNISVPALYMAGESDIVLSFPGVRQRIADMAKFVPQLRRTIILPDCGHWTQQERAPDVNAAMIDFLRGFW